MPRQYKKDALIILGLLAFVYAYFYQDGGSNGNSRLSLIFAMVREGRLTIDTYHDRQGTKTGDKAYFNGHYYSDKAIGPSLVGAITYAPLYWIRQHLHRIGQSTAVKIVTFIVVGLPSAIAGSFIYLLCLYLSKSRMRAFLTTLSITLGTMYLPYSVILFSHQFSASLLFSAFFIIFLLKERLVLWKSWYLFVIGSLLGWALISEFPTLIIICALLFYYLRTVWQNPTLRRFRSIALPALGGAIPILLQMIYNKLCFGNFLSIGYANLANSYYRSGMELGFMGINWPDLRVLYYMTLHPTMGLFWESPVLLFSVIGVVFIFLERRFRQEAILAMGMIGSYMVIMSGYYMWWGGSALGPRHIIPVLPFFCVLLIFVPKRLTWPLVILSLVSIGQMFIAAASDVLAPDDWVSEINTLGFLKYTNIYSYCLKRLLAGKFAWNLGQAILGLQNWASLLPVALVVSGSTILMVLFSTRSDRNPQNQLGRRAS